jgi:nitroimidazol reductase NimA-like FMN-containing flavoprotein (pyridoxamine 5'-phosphate oxidase superfamily)
MDAARPYMPGYGIAATTKGLLPWEWARERLAGADRYWVASVSPDGSPHAMPVWAVWLDEQLWFSTGGRSRKARNLRDRPACTVHPDGDDVVVLNGLAEFVAPPAALLEAYAAKYRETPPDPDENPIVRVRPTTVFGLVESKFSTSPTRWTF